MAPGGTFVSVSAGASHSCGVRTDGFGACWGYSRDFRAEAPRRPSAPGGGAPDVAPVSFASVSVGTEHACGVRADGTLACWGRNDAGQATPPAGAFSSVSAGSSAATAASRSRVPSEPHVRGEG